MVNVYDDDITILILVESPLQFLLFFFLVLLQYNHNPYFSGISLAMQRIGKNNQRACIITILILVESPLQSDSEEQVLKEGKSQSLF